VEDRLRLRAKSGFEDSDWSGEFNGLRLFSQADVFQ